MYFNPITYFFKSFIRVFTRKFFWVLLILLMIIVGWVLYDKGVFATSTSLTYYFNGQKFQVDFYDENGKGSILICDSNGVPYRLLFRGSNQSGDISNFSFDSSNNSVYSSSYYGNVCNFNYNSSTQTYYVNWLSNGGANPFSIPSGGFILYANRDITYYNSSDIYLNSNTLNYNFVSDTNFQEPYFVTSETDIQNWNFDNLEISGGDVPYYTAFPGGTLEDQTTYIELNLEYNYVNYEIGDITRFLTIDEDTSFWSLSIPSIYLTNFINVQNGSTFKFNLYVEQQNPFEQYNISTSEFTFNLTQEQLDKINNDSNKQIQGTIVEQQQQIVEGQQQLQNTITDTTIPPDAEFDLPTIDVNDSTANFFDTLFTGIYNAFNTSEDTSISFTIFSKTITINSADFRMLNDSRFTILRNLLESSWYFAIGYMILKDIRHIFDKIKTGNIENAVSNDIKADMV